MSGETGARLEPPQPPVADGAETRRDALRVASALAAGAALGAVAPAGGASAEAGAAPRSTDRFDKFTERAKKVLVLAQEEAQRFNHNYIGTEHLLLGLVREGEGIAARVLSNLGVELNKVRSAVEFIIGRGDQTVSGDISLTPRAKKVIELSVEEARRLRHNHIGTEHLLLGLVREGGGIGAGVLAQFGVTRPAVERGVLRPAPPG
jgi:hypothetical protein